MKREEARCAEAEKTKPRTLYEMDYLLLVHDVTRQGALRFTNNPGEPFIANDGPLVPPLVNPNLSGNLIVQLFLLILHRFRIVYKFGISAITIFYFGLCNS